MRNVQREYSDTVNENLFENDYVENSIGAFGKWQFLVCVGVVLTRFIAIWNMLSIMFLAPKTEFACIQFKDNATTNVQNSTCYKNCVKYEYYEDIFEETLVTQFDLICENAWLASLTQTILMFGLLVGVSLFGWISDRFGRKKALISSGLMAVVFMFFASFSPNYWTITCIRFFIGIACGGILSLNAVYSTEIVGPQYISVAVSMTMFPDAISEATLAVFAYFAPTWQIFLFICTGLSFLIVIVSLILPESPRWLMTKENTDVVIDLMTKAAKYNRLNTADIKDNVIKSKENLIRNKTSNLKNSYLDLFRTKSLAVTTISSAVVWFATGFSYFGLSQYTSQIGTNIYIVVIIMGLSQMPTCFLTVLIAKFSGRRTSVLFLLLIIGATMIVLVFTPEGTWTSTILGVLGATASNTLFSIVYILTIELYPTPIRNMGFSFSSASSKLGAMVAPFVLNIRLFWIVLLIFSVVPFVAIFFCFLLPETKGQRLKDTLEE